MADPAPPTRRCFVCGATRPLPAMNLLSAEVVDPVPFNKAETVYEYACKDHGADLEGWDDEGYRIVGPAATTPIPDD